MPDQKIAPLPANPIQLSYAEWEERFKPIKNPIKTDASIDGCAFETYGDELTYVQAERDHRPACVWTITTSGDYTVLGDGYHFVDRFLYLITEIPCPANEHYEIILDEPEEISDEEAMTEIVQLMSGTDWSPDTLEEIADICRRAGHEIEDTPEDA